ncbi:MAG: UDP-N-acetylmuramate:L-alanyl-gamma-D-glutamyl-meso-diaminopimelate ligase [Pseudomonadales bacterium]|jgi:UDP-N-acetylmuramate: L-alanyl-gamma-D-glutamyl-meso-diaminopimelate ligase|nr:UDP-N-acetylmuramate:L-alanyl-gamma-D-glutamyl-meso-diaminopimelate ligase [Pseudomonadales bacterium]
MRIHILGICGTFMGSLAVLAKELGHGVSGSDQNVYPPMSTQLEQAGIKLSQGYEPEHIEAAKADLIVIGNTCSRGNAAVEYVLERGLPFVSGPAWLAEHVLRGRWVLAVAGTHGKTTTSSMLAWILDYAGLAPGYLIGGVPKNFEVSARLGGSDFFVIEADEYDSAFFDKRSKFIHYLPRTLVMNNLEFDHADIFRSLEDIQIQFHHLAKTIPATGRIIAPAFDGNLDAVFARGVWSELERFGDIGDERAAWQVRQLLADGSALELRHGENSAELHWSLLGGHNAYNAIAAAAAALQVGVPLHVCAEALSCFEGVKRRLETLGEFGGVRLYDDFAHHPTAIATTLAGLRATMQKDGRAGRLIAVIEARSNTMKMGYHQNTLAASLAPADAVLWYKSAETKLDLDAIAQAAPCAFHALDATGAILDWLLRELRAGDQVVIMSNGGFEGLQQRLREALQARELAAAG